MLEKIVAKDLCCKILIGPIPESVFHKTKNGRFRLTMNFSSENSTEGTPTEPTEYYYIDGDIDAVLYQRYEKNMAVSELVSEQYYKTSIW